MRRVILGCIVTAAAGAASIVLASPRPAATAASTCNVDNVHSSVVFCVRHMNVANFYGHFNTLEGHFALDGDDSHFEFSIPVDSIDTNNEARDKHMKSKEYFNVDEHKAISFKSSKVKASGDTFEVAGDMSMLGKTVPMTVTITKTGEAQGRGGKSVVGLESTFTVKRSEFGMTAGGTGLGDDVKLIVSIEGVRE